MSDKLCLQWNDFEENVNSAFGRLREDKEFTDVTLACEDGQQIEAHKVILAASSPFFEEIFQKCKHPHPLIYLRGFQAKDFGAILDFLYSFLAIAEEIKLTGLTGSDQTFSEIKKEEEEAKDAEASSKIQKPTTRRKDMKPDADSSSSNTSIPVNLGPICKHWRRR